jgi:hypothetical protein
MQESMLFTDYHMENVHSKQGKIIRIVKVYVKF